MKILKRGILSQGVPLGRTVSIIKGCGEFVRVGSLPYPTTSDWVPTPYYKNKASVDTDVWVSPDHPSYDSANITDYPANNDNFELYENTPPETLVATVDITGLTYPVFAMSDHYTDGEGLAYSFSDVIESESISEGGLKFLCMDYRDTRIYINNGGDTYTQDLTYGTWGTDVKLDCPNLDTTNHIFQMSYWNGSSWVLTWSSAIQTTAGLRHARVTQRVRTSNNDIVSSLFVYRGLGRW